MKNRPLVPLLFLVLLALWGCSDNIFGGGDGKKSECGQDIACLRIEAEEYFRNAKFEESYRTYQKITEIDPKASVGWFGMAKTGMWRWRVTPFNIGGIIKGSEDLEALEVIQRLGITERNRFLQGAKNAYRALDSLNRRDSLTVLWHNTNGSQGAQLSDMEFRQAQLEFSFILSKSLHDVLGSVIFDAWGYGCIFDSKPANPLAYGCDTDQIAYDKSFILDFDADGNFTMDLEALEAFLESEEGVEFVVETINTLLEELENSLDNLIGFIGSFTGDDIPGGHEEEVDKDELQQQIEEFKDYALFYKLNDGIDNDGDGCIDEELVVNGKVYDVDGDGLYGEDARLLFIPTAFWICSNVPGAVPNECTLGAGFVPRYNDANGDEVIHNARSNAEDWFIMRITQGEGGTIDTTVRVAWSLEENGFIRGPDYSDIEIRKDVQTEKTKCWSLAERQARIGGCWHNYDREKFIKYRNNPLQIERGGMNPNCINIY
ncbi:MAG: hypothetical protein LBC85_07680 [Fibromonadaceae bacterium]|jgi:hypothetical protein|nr:hypothetical protein [Fibromonadaceae bacterium]